MVAATVVAPVAHPPDRLPNPPVTVSARLGFVPRFSAHLGPDNLYPSLNHGDGCRCCTIRAHHVLNPIGHVIALRQGMPCVIIVLSTRRWVYCSECGLDFGVISSVYILLSCNMICGGLHPAKGRPPEYPFISAWICAATKTSPAPVTCANVRPATAQTTFLHPGASYRIRPSVTIARGPNSIRAFAASIGKRALQMICASILFT